MEQELATINCAVVGGEQFELIQFGFPLPQGQYQAHNLTLLDENGQSLAASLKPTSYWPDHTIRWCQARLLMSLASSDKNRIYAGHSPNPPTCPKRPQLVSLEGNILAVRTREFFFELNRSELSSFSAKNSRKEVVCQAGRFELFISEEHSAKGYVQSCAHETYYAAEKPLFVEVHLKGFLATNDGASAIACFEQTYKFHYHSNKVETSFTLHNPKAAIHEGGTWDLGDPNSLLFDSCAFHWTVNELETIGCFDELTQQQLRSEATTFSLYQESSGGESWDSLTHLNREAKVPMSHKGYRLEANSYREVGDRILPRLSLKAELARIEVMYKDFWQNFPSAMSVKDGVLALSLFPEQYPDLHELQPGERKTQEFTICLSQGRGAGGSYAQPWVQLNLAWLIKCQALPWLSSSADPLQALINKGLVGEDSFMAKREAADEYGWRNFGELYADHEAEGYQGGGLFVSHYNNQYDPIYGLYRQALIIGSFEVLQGARELTRHVTDIDIYHTHRDKDEYNHGLFWHTDHYQKGETCSHRTYSKRHQRGVYEDHAGGGGPGGQHCYTTGLLLDYWLTGNEHSKQSVLQLADWITLLYEGKGTFVELLLSWKNRYRQDVKNFFTERYPLDRGIGNYIVALLDAYAITHKSAYLRQIAQIIRDTVHPLDDINQRNFDDVEATWFYTVFLQAVARFLWVKREHQELDSDFIYARDCLSHYARWMAEHEEPALNQPERLEFPNLTWAAQDLRKVNVLYLASYFDVLSRECFREKADLIYQKTVTGLEADSSHVYTRIQAILMQNQGVREWVLAQPEEEFPEAGRYRKVNNTSSTYKLKRLLQSVMACTLGFSIRKELDQLRRRFPKLTKFVGPLDEQH
ncbi:hypothetical protein K0504_11255 [Neiella marina]|uniref:PcRGLX/YetA-like N-terminal RIFT barrel domain-containing protein n=1 Tax=Neiella holothuriorum TaxID=2870530 RepID=A0ABS7EHC4_9GAMM|nr:hypothetical protein [Neiella holothuriorum]MBW8191615.1 hypothetical protein [Neiella holothuriorum]